MLTDTLIGMNEAISSQQFVDASGSYLEVASNAGLQVEQGQKRLMYPNYSQAAIALGYDPSAPYIMLRNAHIAANKQVLRALGGLRVIAAIKTTTRNAYVPGVLLQDGAAAPRVGCLLSPFDVRSTSQQEAVAPLTDLQQLLLAKIVAEHQPETAQHSNGQVNGAEIGHAVLVAASVQPYGIHSAVHDFAGSGNFSARIADSGATDLQTSAGIRANREGVYRADQLAGIVIVRDHQSPWPLGGDSFDVSVGFTHAAVQSNTERPQPNLQANLEGLLEAA